MGEKAFGGRDGEQRGDRVRACTLAEDRHIVGVAAEHRDVVADPPQRHHEVPQVQVVVDGDVLIGQRRQVQAPQRAEPVVHRHVHAPLACQRRTVIDRGGRAAHEVAAAVDEDHDRQRRLCRSLRRRDVERQAVLAHRLILAGGQDRVRALLRRAVAESVAVPNTRPWLDRLRSAQPQPSHRRAGVRNGAPAVHPVAGEALDSS